MLSLAQIAAIVGLLFAFGVDQPTINNVQGILGGGTGAPTAAVEPVVQPLFKLESHVEKDTFAVEKKVTLATFVISAGGRELKANTFAADVKFSTSSNFSTKVATSSVTVEIKCSGLVLERKSKSCPVIATFHDLGNYHYAISNLRIGGASKSTLDKYNIIVEGEVRIR